MKMGAKKNVFNQMLSSGNKFEKLCRICMKSCATRNLIDIFTSFAGFNLLSQAIMECAPVNISPDDTLPHRICNHCVSSLTSAHQFRTLCLKSDISLRQYTNQVTDSTTSNEIVDVILKEEKDDDDNDNDWVNDDYKSLQDYNVNEEYKDTEIKEETRSLNNEDIINTDSETIKNEFEIHKRSLELKSKKIVKRKTRKRLKSDFDETYDRNVTTECDQKVENEASIHVTNNDTSKSKKSRGPYRKRQKVDGLDVMEEIHYCDSCRMTFVNRPNLLRHLRTHGGEKNFSCNLCQKKFATQAYVKSHMIIHTNERKFSCDICGKTFMFNSDLTVHMRKHTGERPYVCEVCAKGFVSSSALNAHRFKHGPKRFFCIICNKGFTYKQESDSHIFAHRNDKFIIIDDPDKSKQIIPSVVEQFDSELPDADNISHKEESKFNEVNENIHIDDQITFDSLDVNTAHMLSMNDESSEKNNINCNGNGNILSSQYVTNYGSVILNKVEKEPYKITKENYEIYITTYKRLKNVVRAENFTCDVCNKVLSSISNLYRHKLIHTGLKPYPCEICNKSFKLKADLQEHKNRHLGIRKIQCEFCPKMFATKSDYGKHVSTHMDHKPFICDICSKSYYNIYALNQHRKDHLHAYKCEHTGCLKSYPTEEKLTKHIKIHDETRRRFHCEFCDHSLSSIKSLMRHVRKLHNQEQKEKSEDDLDTEKNN